MNENRAMSKTDSSDASAGQDAKPESPAAMSTDKHPNLTLLESGQNPGDILRAAREKAGYSLSDISAQTKINERQLLAIESGDVGRLPPETFAKAFIKSYCKALKMDASPVILAFGYSEMGAQARAARTGQLEAGRTEPFEPKMPSSSKRLSTLNFDRKSGKKSLSYGVVLAALAVMAVFYIPVFLSNQGDEVTDEAVIEPNEAPVAAAGSDQGVPLTPIAPPAEGTAVFPALQPQPPSGATAPATVPLAQEPAANTTLTAPVAPQASAPAASVAQPVTPPVSSAAAPAVAPAVPPVSTTQGALRFNFKEQSWVTVRDANDKVLISQLNESGSTLEVRGLAPFKLIVGNASAVTVSNNGKPVNLSSAIQGEVARVTVQ